MKPYYDDGRGIVIYHGDCRVSRTYMSQSPYHYWQIPCEWYVAEGGIITLAATESASTTIEEKGGMSEVSYNDVMEALAELKARGIEANCIDMSGWYGIWAGDGWLCDSTGWIFYGPKDVMEGLRNCSPRNDYEVRRFGT